MTTPVHPEPGNGQAGAGQRSGTRLECLGQRVVDRDLLDRDDGLVASGIRVDRSR